MASKLSRRQMLLGGGALALVAGIAACGGPENYTDTLTIADEGTKLRLDGVINARSPSAFSAALDSNPGITEIYLGQIKGSVDPVAVARMGRLIRRNGLATRMDARSAVFSGGVDLHLGGARRIVAPGASVGVHDWVNAFGEQGRDFRRDARAHEPTRSYTAEMLGTDAFYWFALNAAPHDQVHFMTRSELQRYGLITN